MLRIVYVLLAMILAASSVAARDGAESPIETRPMPAPAPEGSRANKLGEDQIVFYDFDNGTNTPDPQGWTSVDRTESTHRWQVSDFHCDNLDPESDNHAWWCGEELTPCIEGDEPGGYGPQYDEWLLFEAEAPDPGAATDVDLTADLNVDLEEGYDFLYLEVFNAAGQAWIEKTSWTGTFEGLPVSESFEVPSTYYDNGMIRLRFRVMSDYWYDGVDCDHANEGAAQIDNIEVSFDGGSISLEDCEGGEPYAWTPFSGGVGDYAQLWPVLNDIDACADHLNETPRWCFVDVGQTGGEGTPGVSWLYGPQGHVVNPTGGSMGPGNAIWNEIWSPPIPWDDDYQHGLLEYDMYAHFPHQYPHTPGIGYVRSVRSTADSGGEEGWSDWSDENTFWYNPTPVNRRMSFDISPYLVEDCKWIQVALGVKQFPMAYYGNDATPAPYYDNVSVTAVDGGPYVFSVDERYLAQDAFPESGQLHIGADPGHAWVRFDRAENVGPAEAPVRGDHILFSVTPLVGEDAPVSVIMRPVLHPNTAFDVFRYEDLIPVHCWPTGTPGQYACDLPDSSAIFPGDVVHYYFEAHSEGYQRFSTWPIDLTDLYSFDDDTTWPEAMTMRALPSLKEPEVSWQQPSILLWNDSGYVDEAFTWPAALRDLGLELGVDYDLYTTSLPGYDLGNGLGAAATAEQLVSYETILYAGGSEFLYGLCDGSAYCAGDDVSLLEAYLLLGDKDLVVAGDHTAYGLSVTGAATAEFLSGRLGVTFVSTDIGSYTSPASQDVSAAAGNGVFDDDDTWTVERACPYPTLGDAVSLDTAQGLATFDLATGYSAASLQYDYDSVSRVIFFPYDLGQVAAPDSAKAPQLLTGILTDVLVYLDHGAVPVFLQAFTATPTDGAVRLDWQVGESAGPERFRVTARRDGLTWPVAVEKLAWGTFQAHDEAPVLRSGGTIAYTLDYADEQGRWSVLDETAVELERLPERSALTAAHPNPFNPSVRIAFSLDRGQEIRVSVYDAGGRHVAELARGPHAAGSHDVTWTGEDDAGRRLPSGPYFVRLETDTQVDVRKITMLK